MNRQQASEASAWLCLLCVFRDRGLDMTWTVFITAWIVFQAAVKAAKQPKLCKQENKTHAQMVGGIFGSVLWGAGMIAALYMAGLYT